MGLLGSQVFRQASMKSCERRAKQIQWKGAKKQQEKENNKKHIKNSSKNIQEHEHEPEQSQGHVLDQE